MATQHQCVMGVATVDPRNPDYNSSNEGSPPGNDNALAAAASNNDRTGEKTAAKPRVNSFGHAMQGGSLLRPMGNKAAKKLVADADRQEYWIERTLTVSKLIPKSTKTEHIPLRSLQMK